uniref:Uncharacterized protein n=1 Tax=Salix viminalis TaxID=40686 RepID=A0A6N2M9U9_SALVM
MTSLLEWKIMFIGLGELGGQGPLDWPYTFFGDQDAKYASDLIKVLEGANQQVPPEIRDMASRGGGGMGRFRRWGSGGNDGGRGGRSDFGFGGRGSRGMSNSSSGRPERGGGRGYDQESRDRYDRGYGDGHDKGNNHNRSPDKGSSGWGDRIKSWSRDRSRSRSPDRHDRAPPVRSFHQAMMEKGRASPPRQVHSERSRSPYHGSGGSFHKEMTEQGRPSSYHAQPERGRSLSSGHDRGLNGGPVLIWEKRRRKE